MRRAALRPAAGPRAWPGMRDRCRGARDPERAVRRHHVQQQLEVDVANQEATLNVVVRFLVDNPTGTRLLIPRHGYAVLDGAPGPPGFEMTRIHTGDTGTPGSCRLGPRRASSTAMTLSLSPTTVNQALAYLGWEAVYELQAIVDLGALNPPSGPPTLRHRGSLKLPLPPQIAVDGPRRSSSWAASSILTSRRSRT